MPGIPGTTHRRKTCNQCGESKGIGNFHRNKNTGDGYYSLCKDCTNRKNKLEVVLPRAFGAWVRWRAA